jgi:nucleolar MIF4G domain-containing protein 1
VCNIERTGRWWLVGASWVGRKAVDASEVDDAAHGSGGNDDELVEDGVTEPSADAALLELATKQRMNTVVKKNVFVALMGAEDPEAAMDRLLKLGLKVCRDAAESGSW